VKIDINQISPKGLRLTENFTPSSLDLETDLIKFSGPIKVQAEISKLVNVVTVHLALNATMHTICSRCLEECDIDFKKDFALNFSAKDTGPSIDLDPEIREEIILDYPIKPLCRLHCKGLCAKCGRNLNERNCSCRVKG